MEGQCWSYSFRIFFCDERKFKITIEKSDVIVINCAHSDVFINECTYNSNTVNKGIIDCGCPENLMGRSWFK